MTGSSKAASQGESLLRLLTTGLSHHQVPSISRLPETPKTTIYDVTCFPQKNNPLYPSLNHTFFTLPFNPNNQSTCYTHMAAAMTQQAQSSDSKSIISDSTQSIASTQKEEIQTTSSSSSSSALSWSTWKSKLHIPDHFGHSTTTPPVPGKEKWRDATLSDKERWKEWQKAKDREQMRG